MAIGAAVLALSAQFRMEVSGLPLTLQTLVLWLIAAWFRPAAAFGTATIYLLAGLVGLPVFSGGEGGWEVLKGPYGGFLLAFPLAAAVASNTAEGLGLGLARRRMGAIRCLLGPMIFGTGLLLMIGILRLAAHQGKPAREVLDQLLPTLLWPSLAKVAVASVVGAEFLVRYQPPPWSSRPRLSPP